MGDASNSTAAGAAPAAAKYSLRGWVVAHWQGELSLGDAFWTNGVILNLVIAAVDWGLDRLSGDYPTWPWIVVIAPFATFVLIVPIWQVVGIWRSARHFRGRQLHDGRHVGRWLWAVVACVLSFCWFLKTVAVAVDALR